LVQALLSGAPNFEQLALRAIRERTGEELARIITGSAADAMVATGTATMISEGRAFVAPLAPDARAAWALWLNRWLELAAMVGSHAPRGLWDDPTGFPSWPRLRQQVAHRIAAARLRRESLTVSLLRIEDVELWNRRSQILLDNSFMARIATALDAAVFPGDELARLDDGGFVLVSLRESATQELAAALRAEIASLPGDGPRSLVVHVGVAAAPWDATDPDSLLELAARRAAASSNQG
jgi:GGDEF domain-containing protein